MSTMLILLLIVVVAIAAVAVTLGVFIHKNKKAGYTAFGKRRDGGPDTAEKRRKPSERAGHEQALSGAPAAGTPAAPAQPDAA